MHIIPFASVLLAVIGLVFLKDNRPEYRRLSRVALVVGPAIISFLAFMAYGAAAAVLVLAVFAVLAVWRLRS